MASSFQEKVKQYEEIERQAMNGDEDGGYRVELYIYDMTKGIARAMSPSILGKQIEGIWHTGVVAYGREYFFGSGGIESCRPGGTILGEPDRVEELGESQVPYQLFLEYIFGLGDSAYKPSAYDLLKHNCNNFSEEIAQFLCGRGIPKTILSLPDEVLNTSLGEEVSSALQKIKLKSDGVVFGQVNSSIRAYVPRDVERHTHDPEFDALNSAIEEVRNQATAPRERFSISEHEKQNSAVLANRRSSLNEKLLRKERKEKRRKEKKEKKKKKGESSSESEGRSSRRRYRDSSIDLASEKVVTFDLRERGSSEPPASLQSSASRLPKLPPSLTKTHPPLPHSALPPRSPSKSPTPSTSTSSRASPSTSTSRVSPPAVTASRISASPSDSSLPCPEVGKALEAASTEVPQTEHIVTEDCTPLESTPPEVRVISPSVSPFKESSTFPTPEEMDPPQDDPIEIPPPEEPSLEASSQVRSQPSMEGAAEAEPKEPPIVFKDDIDTRADFDGFVSSCAERLSPEEQRHMEELRAYIVEDEGSWALGEDFNILFARVFHDPSIPDEARYFLLRIMAAAALKDDVILMLHQDRREHTIMNFANKVESLSPDIQESVAIFFCNMFEHLSPSEWLLYISEWTEGNQQISNIRVTTKVAVNALLHQSTKIQDYGTALMYNLGTKEVKTVVFDDVAPELAMAILQFFSTHPPEEFVWRTMTALCKFCYASAEVAALIKMIGPEPGCFKGLSERVDFLIEEINSKLERIRAF